MASLLDSDAGTERFGSYEADLKLVQADVNQKLDQIPELAGEPRKAAVRQAERALEEAREILDQMRIEKPNIPAPAKSKVNARFRNLETDVDGLGRRLKALAHDRRALFGARYSDQPGGGGGSDGGAGPGDDQLEQRQQLLSGTERLGRSSNRLRDSHRVALETEEIGRSTLGDLHTQREQIEHTRRTLLASEGYTDRSIKTLRGMARRMATNRIITIAIISVLVLLIIAVIVSKFRR